jgi:hypothetical protein
MTFKQAEEMLQPARQLVAELKKRGESEIGGLAAWRLLKLLASFDAVIQKTH